MDPTLIFIIIVVLLIGAFIWYKNDKAKRAKEFEAKLQQLPESERQSFISHRQADQSPTGDHNTIQIQRLKSPNKNVRYDACEELRVASTISQETIAALEKATRDPDHDVADAAQNALTAQRLTNFGPASGAVNAPAMPAAAGPTMSAAAGPVSGPITRTQVPFSKLSAAMAILLQPATVYDRADTNAASVGQLRAGDMIRLGEVKTGKQAWVKVSLPDGHSGFLLGDTRVFRVQKLSLQQENVDVYSAPSTNSSLVERINQGAKFFMVNSRDGWLEIYDLNRTGGYINAQTQVKVEPYVGGAAARSKIAWGALWFIGGCMVTALSYSAASSGGTYLITWGAIIFGGIQFLQGLSQLAQADD